MRPRFPVVLSLLLAITTFGPASAAGTGGARPMPGERHLTGPEKAAALAAMGPIERASIGGRFSDPRVIVATHARRYFKIEPGPGGSQSLRPVGIVADDPGSSLSIPSLETGAVTSNYRKYDLFISVTVSRLSGYRWEIYTYVYWYGGREASCCNRSMDVVGQTWNRNLAYESQSASGRYRDCLGPIDGTNMAIYRDTISPGEGVGWEFAEWRNCYEDDWSQGIWAHGLMHHAEFRAYVSESRWQGEQATIASTYYHTFPYWTTGYGLSFSGPSMSISPTNDQWRAAVAVSISV